MWEKLKLWWSDFKAVPFMDRYINDKTLYALIIGGGSLGLWVIDPDKAVYLTGTLVSLWTTYKFFQKKGE